MNLSDGDSSEEDEEIEVAVPNLVDKSSVTENGHKEEEHPGIGTFPAPVQFSLMEIDEPEEEEVDEPLPLVLPPPLLSGIIVASESFLPTNGHLINESDSIVDGSSVAALPIAQSTSDDLKGTQDSLNPMEPSSICSNEYTEAVTALAIDPWDISSWMILLEEVEHGRGGTAKMDDTCTRFLDQFPRSARFWMKLASYYSRSAVAGDHIQIQQTLMETFEKCLNKCRSVPLWKTYLAYVKKTSVDVVIAAAKASNAQPAQQQIERYYEERKKTEQAYEAALDNVGMAVDAGELWREYIDFILNFWSLQAFCGGSAGMIEAGKRIAAVRRTYQRAVCVPMDSDMSDELWSEFETFEKSCGEVDANSTIEFHKRHQHARSIFRDRKRLTTNIVFDRLAVPPSVNSNDSQQVEYWNNWIRFEMGNPDNLTTENYRQMLRMVFEQCLCAFRYNTEIWLSFAKFELDNAGVSAAREIYSEAIAANPSVSLLRIAMAEMEEVFGNYVTAKSILQKGFEDNTSGFTFSLLQKFVRRIEGVEAARKVFSDTFSLRQSSPALGLQIFLSHAKLEFEVNNDPKLAVTILNLARSTYSPALCMQNVHFVKQLCRILTAVGDIQQIRWIFQTALDYVSQATGITGIDAATAGSRKPIHTGKSQATVTAAAAAAAAAASSSTSKSSNNRYFAALKDEWELLEEFLQIEVTLGQCGIKQLNLLRERRDKARTLLEESQRTRLGLNVNIGSKDREGGSRDKDKGDKGGFPGIFEVSYDLIERYDPSQQQQLPQKQQRHLSTMQLFGLEQFVPSTRQSNAENGDISNTELFAVPEADLELKERIFMKKFSAYSSYPGMFMGEFHSGFAAADGILARGRNTGTKRDRDGASLGNMSAEFHISMAGLPAILRDLLAKLPLLGTQQQTPDVDVFLRHMKSIVLPPRPTAEEAVALVAQDDGDDVAAGAEWLNDAARAADEDDDAYAASANDFLQQAIISSSSTVLGRPNKGPPGSAPGAPAGAGVVQEEDTFRQRQRLRQLN